MCVSLDISSCPGTFTPFRVNGFPLVHLNPILISESKALTGQSFSQFSNTPPSHDMSLS